MHNPGDKSIGMRELVLTVDGTMLLNRLYI
jgi:hypothetical protein